MMRGLDQKHVCISSSETIVKNNEDLHILSTELLF